MSSSSPLRRPLRRRRHSSDGRTLSAMSCARTPSWNRPQPRRSPTKTSRWCVGSFFELPLSDVTTVDGERAVLECRVAVTPAVKVCLVSIVREVEREMESIGRPATKSSTRRTDPHTSAAPLNNDDRELSAFYATQIDAHAADVDVSTVGDIIARHVTDQSVGDRIAAAANELCSQQKTGCHDVQGRCFGQPATCRAEDGEHVD